MSTRDPFTGFVIRLYTPLLFILILTSFIMGYASLHKPLQGKGEGKVADKPVAHLKKMTVKSVSRTST